MKGGVDCMACIAALSPFNKCGRIWTGEIKESITWANCSKSAGPSDSVSKYWKIRNFCDISTYFENVQPIKNVETEFIIKFALRLKDKI